MIIKITLRVLRFIKHLVINNFVFFCSFFLKRHHYQVVYGFRTQARGCQTPVDEMLRSVILHIL